MTKKNNAGENIFLIVVDGGGMRQVFSEDHTPLDFVKWQQMVVDSLMKEGGKYEARIMTMVPGGLEARKVVVTLPAGGTVTFMTTDDMEAAKRKAELAQGGQIIRGR